jgi:hypothetical protein
MLEMQFDARLLRALVALSRGDTAAVLAAADEIERWTAATGFQVYRGLPARLAVAAAATDAGSPPPLAELVASLLRHN